MYLVQPSILEVLFAWVWHGMKGVHIWLASMSHALLYFLHAAGYAHHLLYILFFRPIIIAVDILLAVLLFGLLSLFIGAFLEGSYDKFFFLISVLVLSIVGLVIGLRKLSHVVHSMWDVCAQKWPASMKFVQRALNVIMVISVLIGIVALYRWYTNQSPQTLGSCDRDLSSRSATSDQHSCDLPSRDTVRDQDDCDVFSSHEVGHYDYCSHETDAVPARSWGHLPRVMGQTNSQRPSVVMAVVLPEGSDNFDGDYTAVPVMSMGLDTDIPVAKVVEEGHDSSLTPLPATYRM